MGWFGSKDIVTTNVVISTDTFLEHLNDLQGTKNFRLLDGLTAVVEGAITGLQELFNEEKVTKNIDGMVIDGIATQRLIELVSQTNIGVIITEKKGPLSGVPNNLDVLTRASLNSPEFRDLDYLDIQNSKREERELKERARRMRIEKKVEKSRQYDSNKRKLPQARSQKERKREEKQQRKRAVARALDKEKHLDYDGTIAIYEEIGDKKSAKRVRKLKADMVAPKTEIHGDYVDDRDTIIKDSVISKSNVGAGGSSKMQELKELKEMFDSGFISKEEMEKMKKEILGK